MFMTHNRGAGDGGGNAESVVMGVKLVFRLEFDFERVGEPGHISKIVHQYPTVPGGTRRYAVVPGSRIIFRVPSSEIRPFSWWMWSAVVRGGTRWYAKIPMGTRRAKGRS